MTIDQIILVILILLFAIGAILAVFYIWFAIWKTTSERSGNIVTWPEDDASEKNRPDPDGNKKD